ncbi:hypothetical protein [Bartonella birtlesii]|nr:hypothetical protein [Bartonella birtlesii]
MLNHDDIESIEISFTVNGKKIKFDKETNDKLKKNIDWEKFLSQLFFGKE